MKNKITFIISILFCFSGFSQKNNPSQKFITYLNNYQEKELATIITSDFKLKRSFSSIVTNRKEFLASYLKDCETLIAKYKIIEQPNEENQNYYLVLDQSQYLKLLQVKFPTWKMFIKTVAGKVSEVTLEPTEDYESYLEELNSKTELFYTWMSENYPEADIQNTNDLSVTIDYLNTYIQLNDVGLFELEQYDDNQNAKIVTIEINDDLSCIHRNKYSAVKRTSFYPFNKAKKVLLISFIDQSSNSDYYSKNNKIDDLSVAKNSKTLTKNEINSLTDLIFNMGFKKMVYEKFISATSPCPDLKNAIVFVDQNEKPFEYIELFFGCDQIEFSSKEIEYGDDCTNKLELIKQFFISNGIDVGQ
jgi:hypothetical protein